MSYHDGKIYKITSKQTDKIYIGSTKQTLELRFGVHKCIYTEYLKSNKVSTTSVELLKYEDCEIVLIELFPCLSKRGLCRREGEIQLENISIIVNRRIAGRTKKEWYAEHKENIVKQKAQYHLDNKEEINKRRAKYYLDNKEKFAKRNAQYYLDNKEEIDKQSAQYRLDKKLKNK